MKAKIVHGRFSSVQRDEVRRYILSRFAITVGRVKKYASEANKSVCPFRRNYVGA